MSEEKICEYCRHAPHEGRRCVVQMAKGPVLFHNGKCNCDGKSQYFYVQGETRAEAEALAGKVVEAGYEIVTPPATLCKDGIVPLADEKGDRIGDSWGIVCHSSALPPVASYEEFKRLVGL